MTQLCSICRNPAASAINLAVAEGATGLRAIAGHYGVKRTSLQRHIRRHLAPLLAQAREAREHMQTESLNARLAELEAITSRVMARGEKQGDDRLILLGVREARLNVESLHKLAVVTDLEARLSALESESEANPDGELPPPSQALGAPPAAESGDRPSGAGAADDYRDDQPW